jgi:hypothetical protein
MSNRSGSQGGIAIKAYDLYVKRGMTDGHDFDDWLQAEKIVMSQHAISKKDKTGTSLQKKIRVLKKG